MSRGKKYGPEESIPKLREAEVLMSQVTTQELPAKRLKELEKENTRLKRLLADTEVAKAILRETVSGNF